MLYKLKDRDPSYDGKIVRIVERLSPGVVKVIRLDTMLTFAIHRHNLIHLDKADNILLYLLYE